MGTCPETRNDPILSICCYSVFRFRFCCILHVRFIRGDHNFSIVSNDRYTTSKKCPGRLFNLIFCGQGGSSIEGGRYKNRDFEVEVRIFRSLQMNSKCSHLWGTVLSHTHTANLCCMSAVFLR